MAAYVIAVFKVSNMVSTDVQRKYFPETGVGAAGANRAVNGVAKLCAALTGGMVSGSLAAASVIDAAGTASSGTIACVRANAAGNYVQITYGGLNIRFTEGAGADFLRGADDAATATNLAAAINANARLKTILSAVALTDTVTLTLRIPTSLPHGITMTTDDATAFTLTQIAGGTSGTASFFLQGFQTSKTL